MRLALIGDIGLFGRHGRGWQGGNGQRYAAATELFASCRAVIGNLEVPFVDAARCRGYKSAFLKTPTANATTLREIGVTAVSLASNHSFDYGRAGITETCRALDSEGVAWFGLDGTTFDVTDETTSVRLRGYCSYSTNPQGLDAAGRGRGLHAYDVGTVTQAIGEDRRAGRFPIVSVHTGEEHVTAPNPIDVKAARQLAETGPMVFHGHSPHVIQGLEWRNSALLAYSLGNFCFDDVYGPTGGAPLIVQSPENRLGLVLILEIESITVTACMPYVIEDTPDGMQLWDVDASRSFVESRSGCLEMQLEALGAQHRAQLAAYRAKRLTQRDLGWYLKRLRPNYAGVYLRARINRRRFERAVASQLREPNSLAAADALRASGRA